jgi:hypothetical protein
MGPSGYIGWRVGTTTPCHSGLYPPVRNYEFGYMICQKLAAEQLQTRASGMVKVREGGMDRPSQHNSHPAGSLSSRRASVLGHLSSLRPH